MKEKKLKPLNDRQKKQKQEIGSVIDNAQMSTIQSNYPADYDSLPVSLSLKEENKNLTVKQDTFVEMKSIESNLNEIALDENRIVHPTFGLGGLYEFVPATKLKGNFNFASEKKFYFINLTIINCTISNCAII